MVCEVPVRSEYDPPEVSHCCTLIEVTAVDVIAPIGTMKVQPSNPAVSMASDVTSDVPEAHAVVVDAMTILQSVLKFFMGVTPVEGGDAESGPIAAPRESPRYAWVPYFTGSVPASS